jgi:multidrug efflux pump subunit AcrB
MREALAEIREALVRVSGPLNGGRPFPVRIALTDPGDRGEKPLREWADAVADRLRKEGLAADAGVGPRPDVPRLVVDFDRTKMAAVGVSMADAMATLEAAVGGVHVNDFNQFGRTWRVTIGGDPQLLRVDIKRLLVRGKNGKMIPLGNIASLEAAYGPEAVLWVGRTRALRITADPPAGKTPGEAAAKCAEVAEAERKRLGLPAECKVVNLTDE